MLTVITVAVFWQVNRYSFVGLDDTVYVTENSHVQSGITPENIRWAFGTTDAQFWHPLTWLSLMLDYQLYGLNAGGYHLTNLILHILSTLLLFIFLSRATGALWRSAFVAAFFALHPLHVESVAWIAERKDVLSAFFWMLTLCFYVYYTEKPVIGRYLLVVLFLVCSLMSKSMAVTLPVVMIILDYWPLKRFDLKTGKLLSWQIREKALFFILSVIFSITTLHAQPSVIHLPLSARIANAPVSFITYLEKTLWPYDMAVFYPFNTQIPIWLVLEATLLIIVISAIVLVMIKRSPYLFVGWLWYAVTLLPVIGIIQVGNHSMADRYHYIPSIGLAIIAAWGIPAFIERKEIGKNILFPSAMLFLAIMALLAWRQCGTWKNNFELFNHAVQVTTNNALAYNHRGVEYGKLGQYQPAIHDFNETIRVDRYFVKAYYNLGMAYDHLGDYPRAMEEYNKAIRMKPDYADAYYNRGIVNYKIGRYESAVGDYTQAIRFNRHFAEAYHNRGSAYVNLKQYSLAIENYTEAIYLKQNYTDAYCNRAIIYLNQGNKELGCRDARKACELGNCRVLKGANVKGFCQ
jgi:protein O-mannosyl-transferase